MKFRTKIWMLPLSAALVFMVGVAVSYFVGATTLGALSRLGRVEGPALQQLRSARQSVEQFQMLLESATVEGDSDGLKEVQQTVDRTRALLQALGAIDGKKPQADRLRSDFDAYQGSAVAVARAMLDHADPTAQVKKMQESRAALEAEMKAQLEGAVAVTEGLQAQAVHGVETSLWITLAIGIAVLAVLGVASRFVIRSVWQDLGEEPHTLHQLTRRIAQGDLQVAQTVADDRSLHAAIASMAVQLRDTVSTIRDASASIDTASSEIAAGNMELSTRTEASASNLQQTASSIAHLTVTVRQNADAAREVSRIAGEASTAAERGGHIVAQVVSNMQEISTASRQITEIIGVIDGIAFQTNILALNAAVEAARAGEQGRGFAVVAGEVRSLAQRSALAAREVKELIARSSEKVEGGARLVQEAGTSMGEIVAGVRRVTAMIGEISTTASAQSTSIGEVHRAANELDEMTQRNSSLVEEAAAAAGSMRELAGRLNSVVGAFRLGDVEALALRRLPG